nr:hypothetical protein [Tanacetum cinerariifolium]
MLFQIIVKDKRTMDITIDQQFALDEALVHHASRLRIGKSNFRLRSDITSKESTLQVASAIVHHHSIRFKMNNKKHIVNLKYFREMLHICLRIPNKLFDELPFEEEILALLINLGYSGEIKKIAEVNINILHQPWRSFAAVINKCLSVEHKDVKKSNEMYYPQFPKVIVNFFMTKDPSIPRRNKFRAILPVELTNEAIRNSTAYKEYYVIASGAEPPKKKASVRKTQSSSDNTIPPLVAKGTRLQTSAKVDKPAKGKQPAKSSTTKDEGTGLIPGVPDVPTYESDEEISWKSSDEDDDDDVQQSENDEDIDDQSDDESHDDQEDDADQDDDQNDSDNDGDDFVHPKFSTHDEEAKDEKSVYPIVQTPSHMENSDNEGNDDASHGINVGVTKDRMQRMTITNCIDSFFESNPRVDALVTTTVEPLLLTAPTLPPASIPIISQVQQAPAPSPVTAPSTSLQDLLNFGSLFGFDHRLKTLEANFSKFMQTNQFAKSVSFIHEIELKKILIEKMETNKSIYRSDQQKNLYKALVDAYKRDKIILDTYGYTVTLKRRRDDEDKDEEKASKTSSKSTEGSKSYQNTASESAPGEEQMHTTQDLEEPAHLKFKTGAADDQPIAKASQHPDWYSQQAKPPTPDRAWNTTFPATHGCIQPWISDLAKQANSRTSFNELMDTLMEFSAFLMNRLKVDTLIPKLLAGLTYELMKGLCKSLVEPEFFLEEVYKATTDQLDWNNPKG